MTTELSMLVYCCALVLSNPAIYLAGRMGVPGGMDWLWGNRDSDLEAPAWTGRATRAHSNLIENLVPFAALVLVAQVTGLTNETTALGAQLFFWSRVAYLAFYTAGLLYVRTLAHAVGLAGQVMILVGLL